MPTVHRRARAWGWKVVARPTEFKNTRHGGFALALARTAKSGMALRVSIAKPLSSYYALMRPRGLKVHSRSLGDGTRLVWCIRDGDRD
jgi:hypothetical protein